jgi:predicted dehydrogenase
MSELKLGILGLSEGNGHPYSWSAIFNGYNKAIMAGCPFPVIPDYLARQEFPRDAIPGARVTHIWTQDRDVSQHVAAASLIEHVVDRYEDMIGQVDAVLLARDDAENHLTMSAPFIKAGLPVFIDKPIALNVAEVEALFAMCRSKDQIFSCSSLAFARELTLSDRVAAELGTPVRIEARIGKSWEKYAVHVIEPVLRIAGDVGAMNSVEVTSKGQRRCVEVRWETGLVTSFTTYGEEPVPLDIVVTGSSGKSERLVFVDTYAAFKNSLENFMAVVQGKQRSIPKDFLLKVVRIIEAGVCHE